MGQEVRNILRDLAKEYTELAAEDRNSQRRELHRQVNDLESKRPIVLIDEVPWNELQCDALALRSEDPVLRTTEDFLRKRIYQYKHFPGDMALEPYLSVGKVVRSTGIGIGVEEDTITYENDNHIVAHEYKDQFSRDQDLDKLVMPTITYDEKESLRRQNLLEDTLGDVVPVRLTGIQWINVVTWDDISRYRGVTPLLMDLIDRPDFTHKLMRKLTDLMVHTMHQYEALGLLDTEPEYLHCTAAPTNDLPKLDDDGKVRLKNVWGRGAAQILASVSKEMRDEFDIEYMMETIGKCGLSYYGCCEPLDTMIDVVERIPNLRKIGVTPWANVNNACEQIGGRYVVSSKPNPASVAVPNMDITGLKKELGSILYAVRSNGCHADIVLKDISTIHHNPQNLFAWEKTAMDLVRNY